MSGAQLEIQFIFSLIAGALTTLSPCVLPVLPLVLGSALKSHRWAPVATTIGLSFTFVAIGWTGAAFGNTFDFDTANVRFVAGILFVISGAFALSTRLQAFASRHWAPVATQASDQIREKAGISILGGDRSELWSSFYTGLLLGLIWSPCSGPTLGATIAMAASTGGGLRAGSMMLLFAIGAAAPMLAITYGARYFFSRRRTVLRSARVARGIFAVATIAVGLTILFGFDKTLETFLVDHMSESWVDFTTKY